MPCSGLLWTGKCVFRMFGGCVVKAEFSTHDHSALSKEAEPSICNAYPLYMIHVCLVGGGLGIPTRPIVMAINLVSSSTSILNSTTSSRPTAPVNNGIGTATGTSTASDSVLPGRGIARRARHGSAHVDV